jgi:hypothetical protein
MTPVCRRCVGVEGARVRVRTAGRSVRGCRGYEGLWTPSRTGASAAVGVRLSGEVGQHRRRGGCSGRPHGGARNRAWPRCHPLDVHRGTTIAIEASVTPGASPEYWCFEWENCYIVGVVPFLHVYGSNGFYAYAEDWTLAVNDVVPGQTMQGARYTAHGGVQWVVCWGFTYCVQYDYPYEEGWTAPATVTPAAPGPPTADWISPSSGAGPGQITVQYASEGGAGHLAELWLVMHPSGGTTNSCVIGYPALSEVCCSRSDLRASAAVAATH